MRLRPLIFGAIAGVALTVPVVASSLAESTHGWVVLGGADNTSTDLGDAYHGIQVAAVSSRQIVPTGRSSDPLPVAVMPPDLASVAVLPLVDVLPTPVKRPVRAARAPMVVAPQEIAAVTPTAFRPDRLWMIGSFR